MSLLFRSSPLEVEMFIVSFPYHPLSLAPYLMSTHEQPNLNNTQIYNSTSNATSGGLHHIAEHAAPAPTTGILNNAHNTQAQHSNFTDFSGCVQPSVNLHASHVVNYGAVGVILGLHELLRPVNASYENRTGNVARCLAGTRKKVLRKIKKWANGSRPICWLNGSAGSGKSTIAQTIAEWCAERERLAASFFFFRGTGDREDISHLIPTLAFQLSSTVKGMEPLIKDVLRKEPSITNQSIHYQLKKLIMEPILAAPRSKSIQNLLRPKRMVIVIDALDECESMDDFIDAIIDECEAKKGEIPFRLFITSRIEEHLRIRIETSNARKVTLQLKLQKYQAAGDIRLFFRSEFKGIYDAHRLSLTAEGMREPWPSPDVLNILVGEAAGSYIYASTFVNFVRQAEGMPHQKLLDALKAHGLDDVYTQVFSNAKPPAEVSGETVDLKLIMGALLLLEYPLSIKHLAALLNLPPRILLKSFLSIQSILLIPE